MMGGTTLCAHCNTRFKITEAQLEAHEGMVRCGHCLQAFDARPGYIPDQPSPQLELPILTGMALTAQENGTAMPVPPPQPSPGGRGGERIAAQCFTSNDTAMPAVEPPAAAAPGDESAPASDEEPQEMPHDDATGAVVPDSEAPKSAEHPMTLAEQIAVVRDADEDDGVEAARPYRKWPWAIAAFLLLLALLAQAAYIFRVDLAARLPALKPALTGYCQLLGCDVPLPQNPDLMSIESSDLEADAEHVNQITLNALLHNRAAYPQAFPDLELTLNDTNDTPLARRTFKPKDYLPPAENQQTGLRPNQELSVKLHLHTADLRPTGYRLVLFYPQP